MNRVARYAPSPTGDLHLGNIRTALLSWLQARLSDSRFILRIEDLDLPRVKPGSAQQIMSDLLWLGIDWDEGPPPSGDRDNFYQSNRTHHYRHALKKLFEKGLIYPCYCSRKDIREATSAPHESTSIYPGTCVAQYPDMSLDNEMVINGRLPAWRFSVADQDISFEDCVAGSHKQNLKRQVGDFVVRRNDGLFAYQLAVVVDDIEMGITDVLRGMDLLDSTCRQIALYQALGHAEPDYWHMDLMCDENGERLAKRDGSCSLSEYCLNQVSAQTVIGELACSCGLIDTNQPLSVQELLAELTLSEFKDKLRLASQLKNNK